MLLECADSMRIVCFRKTNDVHHLCIIISSCLVVPPDCLMPLIVKKALRAIFPIHSLPYILLPYVGNWVSRNRS